ncbi:MAG TPA: hypothetical protein DDY13_00945 [Cytophagales bacterium]|jgi:multiple antibiotic resistance protein|nr:hypothetical protein [Cytophagales bacterium]
MLNFKEIASVTLILFSVIDIIGSIPIIMEVRKKEGHIQSEKATIISLVLMVVFLFLGESILKLFGIDVQSFAVAGAIILFIIGMEMILGRDFFKIDPTKGASGSIVPLAFPLIAGAGSLTTILTLKSEYAQTNILIGIVINLIFVYLVLKSSAWLDKRIGEAGISVLRKLFGIILLSIAIKIFKTNFI